VGGEVPESSNEDENQKKSAKCHSGQLRFLSWPGMRGGLGRGFEPARAPGAQGQPFFHCIDRDWIALREVRTRP
jgi:hypothetical protein